MTDSHIERLRAAVALFFEEHGRTPSVIFDADGVIYPFDGPFAEYHNRQNPQLPPLTLPFEHYEMETGRPKEVSEAMLASLASFDWSTLHPDPEAAPVLAALLNAGVDVSVATKHLVQNIYQPAAKVYQFHRDFNGHLDNRLVIAQDKTRVIGDWLIDDKPEVNGLLRPTWEHILFTQEYNKDLDGVRVVWSTVIEVITHLIEQRITGFVAPPAAAPIALAEPAAVAAIELAAIEQAEETPAPEVAAAAAVIPLPWETEASAEVAPVSMPWETEATAQEDLPWTTGAVAWDSVEKDGDSK